MDLLIKAVITLGSLGFALGFALAVAYLKLAVKTDPKLEKILEILPGTNCGACGYAGCEGYAQGMATSDAPASLCAPGGEEVARGLAEALGVELGEVERKIAVLRCQGGREEVGDNFAYYGVENCRAAYLVHGGSKSCTYGCLGLGTCVDVCPFNAIRLSSNNLPIVDDELCTGCGLCVDACPVNILHLAPFPQKVYMGCSSRDKGKETRKICPVGCIACKICQKSCPYDAIHVNDNLAEIDYTKCVSCGICVHKCPTKSIVDREDARPYAIIGMNCNGCGECVKVCQFKAIEGQPEERHKVIKENCIGCGQCFQVCQPKSITMAGALGHRQRAT